MSTDPSTPENDADLSALGRELLGTSGSKPSGPWIPPNAEELGRLLPDYEIVKMLGHGGMGAVYMGRQTLLDRPVAIKILSTALEDADPSFVERFKNEARAMGKLNHPGIVKVHDFGETEGGLLYIVMEFVEGTDVARMIAKKGRLHTEHAMAITAHVCDALNYAHERGIIHRDIKPANIMVGYDGVVKVADFGLAKMTHSNATGLTQSGLTMGTLHYMAPEALMLGSAVDHRADIYAVGVMLYQMLAGTLPQGVFKLPSLLVEGLDPRYDGIITKALQEDREARYQAVAEMRSDLDGLLTQPVVRVEENSTEASAVLPTQARPQRTGASPALRFPHTSSAPLPRPAASSSSAWLGWAALGVVALSGGVLWWGFHHRTPAVVDGQPAQPMAADVSTTVPVVSTKSGGGPASDMLQQNVTGVMAHPQVQPLIAGYQNERQAQLKDLLSKYQAALVREKEQAVQSGVLEDVTRAEGVLTRAAAFGPLIDASLTSQQLAPLAVPLVLSSGGAARVIELENIFHQEIAKLESALIEGLDESLAPVQAALVQEGKHADANALEHQRRECDRRFSFCGADQFTTRSLVDVDFSRARNGFKTMKGELAAEVRDGLYRIHLTKGGRWWPSQPALANVNVSDFVFEVVARLAEDSGVGGWGLGMISASKTPWTGVMIDRGGRVSARRYYDEIQLMRPTAGAVHRSPGQFNTLRVEVLSRRVRVFLNGVFVGDFDDPDLKARSLLVYPYAGKPASTKVEVRQIRVWSLSGASG